MVQLGCGISLCNLTFLSIAAVSAGTFERDAVKANLSKSGFRSLAVSSDGKHLAAGDCRGNLHIYNLQTSDYTCFQVEFHMSSF